MTDSATPSPVRVPIVPVSIVTGASSGIGLYAALGLAKAGHRVVMVGRDAHRTEAARRFIVEQSGRSDVDTALADFSNLAEVRRLAEELLGRYERIAVLLNNAGLISPRFERSADGYEMTFAVNHLAPFLLTNLLLDRIRVSAPARIVTVASIAHRRSRVDPATIAGERDWGIMKSYSRSKLCNILFTRELSRRLAGSGVVASCLHPGVVATRFGERGGLIGLAWRLGKMFMVSSEKGAETAVFLATVRDPTPYDGRYVIRKKIAMPDPAALDDIVARALWDTSARLAGLAVA